MITNTDALHDNLRAEILRLEELNRETLKLLDDFLGMVELSPPAQDRFDEILELLSRGEGE